MAASILAAMAITRKTTVAAFRPTLVRATVLPRSCADLSQRNTRLFASVTGSVYESKDKKVVVTLFTKEGCTLCDKVKDVLRQVESEEDFAHSLRQIDITDPDQQDSFDRYKYDIPVLHIACGDNENNKDESVYWTKHRLTAEEAKEGIAEAMSGSFKSRQGRPNASAMEQWHERDTQYN